MKRITTRSIIVVSLLIVGLVFSLQGTILARATKTEVTGVADFSAQPPIDLGEVWVDEGGNAHIKGLVLEGSVSLTIGEETIEGRDRVSLNGVGDAEGNGTYQATEKTYFLGEPGDDPTDDNVIFEGRGQMTDKERQIVSGHFQFQGCNKFEGTKLIITKFVERGTTSVFYLEGILIDPNGDE
jgi:hypothetical protein